MNVTLLQRDIHWCNPEQNRREIERAIMEQTTETDLFLLPEMFTTGFCMLPDDKTAENAQDSPTVEWMKRLAADCGCALGGSIAVKENDHYYNRFYFVTPEGDVSSYNKRHLFTYGGERLTYTAGSERTIVTYKGVRMLVQICYDLRFPVWARNNNDYDMILYSANWPTSRIAVWDTLLRARALENQCYVAAVNRIGNDPLCGYCGHSMAVDAYGKVIACLNEESNSATFTVDMERLQAFRNKFPVLDDRDPFRI